MEGEQIAWVFTLAVVAIFATGSIAHSIGKDTGFHRGYKAAQSMYDSFRKMDNEMWAAAVESIEKDNAVAAELKLKDEDLYNQLYKVAQVKKRMGVKDGVSKKV